MSDTVARLRRALDRKPDATRVELDRNTVVAMLDAIEGKTITTAADAARLINRQPYRVVEAALFAAEGEEGEDAVRAFLNNLITTGDRT